MSHSYPLRFRRAPSPLVANTLSRRRPRHDVKEAFGSKLFFLLFYCISGAPLFIQRMARARRYYGTSNCRRSSSRAKEKRHGENGHTSVWLCGRVWLCLSPRSLVRFLPLLHSSPPSCIPPLSLSLFPFFFFVVDYQMAKRPEKKRSILWGAKARAYTLLFSSRSFFGLRHDDSYHNYTLSRQQSSVLRENKQTKKKGCVCMCVWVRARACRFVSRKHSATFASLSPFWLFLFFVFCFPARHRRRVAPSGTVTAEKNLATSKVFIFFSLHVDCWLEKCTALPDPPFRTQLPVFFFFVRVYLISWCSLQHHYHLRFSLDL